MRTIVDTIADLGMIGGDIDRSSASARVAMAVRHECLKKTACIVCGEAKVQAHHFDYGQPLAVFWLCQKHHTAVHWIIHQRAPNEPEARERFFADQRQSA